jgi:hypothetical protein
MKAAVLLELAKRWERDAREPLITDGSEEAKISNAIREGQRMAKRECADAVKMLISLIGDE